MSHVQRHCDITDTGEIYSVGILVTSRQILLCKHNFMLKCYVRNMINISYVAQITQNAIEKS